ncbi:hypothetical protein MAPG_09841 [Magnaporthiopsis poae ATCC 64411]|uniref:Uncharacterized protein n=1 Tax=Magnaporthiopsis poae (strain ATCC 64411 / 73-15) TaxID=644358 RepID=A0A0C4EB01_MAGP6|nr:hypothetical protein MAPG_09841 [Magnaporthiopsis poae ATCC 64411]
MSRRQALKDKLRASSSNLRVRTKHLGWRVKSKVGDVVRAICNAGAVAATAPVPIPFMPMAPPTPAATTYTQQAYPLSHNVSLESATATPQHNHQQPTHSHGSSATGSPGSPRYALTAEEEFGQTLIKVAAARDAQAINKPRLKVRVRSGSSATSSRVVTPTAPITLSLSAVMVVMDYAPHEGIFDAAYHDRDIDFTEQADAPTVDLSRWVSSDEGDSLNPKGLDEFELEEVFGHAIGYNDPDPYQEVWDYLVRYYDIRNPSPSDGDARSYSSMSHYSDEEVDSVSTDEAKEDAAHVEAMLGLPMHGSPVAYHEAKGNTGVMDTILENEDEWECSDVSLAEFAREIAPPARIHYAQTY